MYMYVLGVEKCVLFREVSSVQGCPYTVIPLCEVRSTHKIILTSVLQYRTCYDVMCV